MYWLPLWAKMLLTILLPHSKIKRQRYINNFWSCILHYVRAREGGQPIINLWAICMCKHASDNIAYVSCNWVRMESQQFLWRFNMLHGNELHCIVPKLNVTRSVFSICPCIQLHKYACNIWQIWLYLLAAPKSIFTNPHFPVRSPNFGRFLESDYPAIKFLPRCQSQNLQTPHSYREWSLQSMNMSLNGIWATLLCKLSSMLGGLQWM